MLLKIYDSKLEIQYHPQGQTFVTNRIGSTKKAEKEIGFRATVQLEDGLKELIKWRTEHKKRFGDRWKPFE
jgi:UDP-glucose 4-epimerase